MSEPVFIHPQAICETDAVGDNTRIWAFAHVLPKAQIGGDCNICDNVFVENDVVIGDRVTVKCGVQLWDGVRIEDDVFVGPNATFTNDPFPRSKETPEKFAPTVVEKGASIGANATLLPGIRIGQRAMVGAGAVVTRDVPPLAIVTGNPAKIVGYVNSHRKEVAETTTAAGPLGAQNTKVSGVTIHRLPLVRDLRGDLSVGEFEKTVPFQPKRFFFVFNVPNRKVRGEHAHWACEQFLICVRGTVSVVADDAAEREEFLLDTPELGLYVPPMVWSTQYKYSEDATLLVFASEYYDNTDYIRDYSAFLEAKNGS